MSDDHIDFTFQYRDIDTIRLRVDIEAGAYIAEASTAGNDFKWTERVMGDTKQRLTMVKLYATLAIALTDCQFGIGVKQYLRAIGEIDGFLLAFQRLVTLDTDSEKSLQAENG